MKNKSITSFGWFGLLCIILIFACSPKTVQVVVPNSPSVPDTAIKEQPKSPCAEFSQLSYADKEKSENAFVIYKDFLKLGKYKEALEYWKIAYNIAPGSNGRAKYHFEDGASIYKHMFENTKDSILKTTYVDTIMMIYDKKKECFGDEAYVNGLKGFDYYYYYFDYTTAENMFQLLKSNFDVKGKNADYFVINPFTRLLYDKVLEGKISNTEGRKYADLIMKTIENGKSICKGKACETWEVIDEYAPVRLESLEGIDDFYDCVYYKNKYYSLYQQYPDSCEIINLAYARMLRGNCLSTDTKLIEVKNAKISKCYVPPPAISCAAQGNEYYNDGKYSKAIESFITCAEQASDKDQKAKYLLLIAKIYYRDLKNYPKSRSYALDAARTKPNWGDPYMLIGNLYASSGPLCGTGRGWESQVVTWPAIDMWTKAKNIDPSIASEANSLISRYTQYMPKREDIFFRSIKAGENYFVPCWIQESTIVRTAD